jgi:uncharacterized protein (TIGR02145 family)
MKLAKPHSLIILIAILTGCQSEPEANFIVNKTRVEIGEEILFINNSKDADHYEWDFGDTQFNISTEVNAKHFYIAKGDYVVSLTAFSKNGKIQDKKVQFIEVYGNLTGIFFDARDGQAYKTVEIGNQNWMAENLNFDAGEGSWAYNSNTSDNTSYEAQGMYYNWETACEVCPEGWHLPSESEFKELIAFLGGRIVAGSKLKEYGTSHWDELDSGESSGATNSSSFTALPNGFYNQNLNKFTYVGKTGYFQSSTESSYGEESNYYLHLYNGLPYADISYTNKEVGIPVRCVKD